ncbi:hypothetical protein EDB87DRAFT_1578283 [Lactarius vividus]|nr:hypothetical protein EDB87DRAFT_1578283 [Lactarius vividus]
MKTVHWLTVITIKTCTQVQGVLEVVLHPDTGTQLLNHLRLKPVWSTVAALTKALVVNKGISTLPGDVQNHFNKIGDKTSVTVDHVNSLEEAFNETLTVLQAAVIAITQLSVFDLTKFESDNMVQEFKRRNRL